VNIHRLDIDAELKPATFAARALERACEIAGHQPCEAIECFDSLACGMLAASSSVLGFHRCPVLNLRSNFSRGTDSALPIGIFGQQSQCFSRTNAGHDAQVVELPAVPNVIPHAPTAGPAFVLPTERDPRTHTLVVAAYKEASTTLAGWSLACATGGGRWMVSPTDAPRIACPEADPQLQFWIAAGSPDQDPIACRIWLRAGGICIVSDDSLLIDAMPATLRRHLVFRSGSAASLAERMSAVARSTASERERWTSEIVGSFPKRFDPHSFVADRRAMWRAQSPRAPIDEHLITWLKLEQTAAKRTATHAETAS
jgi:hypothetical protein